MSSANRTPVRSRDTFSTRAVTVVGWPAGIGGGSSLRAQDSRYRDRRAVSADTSGRMASSAPTRTRSGSGIARPHTMAAPPAATNDRPRVVSEPNTPRMAYLPAPPSGSPPRQGELGDDPVYHLLGQVPLHDGLRGGQQPVGQHRPGQPLHIVGDHVIPPVQRGPGPAGAEQVQGGPRGRAEAQLGGGPRGVGQADDVALDLVRYQYPAERDHELLYVAGPRDRPELVQRGGTAVRVEHLSLGGGRRVAEGNARGEPVPLPLRQRVGAFHLHRVLSGDHHEGLLQRVGGAVDRDLALFH